jgi:hypothetical protein
MMPRRSAERTVGLMAVGALGLLIACDSGGARPVRERSYELNDIKFEVSTEVAEVTFLSHWPKSGYPGAAQCWIVLKDASGSPVGEVDFGLNSGTDGVRTKDIQVPLSGTPVSGEGWCNDLGAAVGGAGYSFDLVSITPVVFDPAETAGLAPDEIPSRSQITFDVTIVTDGADAEFRTCFLEVTRTDGSIDEPHRYDILGGGGSMTFQVHGAPETIANAQVTCSALLPEAA